MHTSSISDFQILNDDAWFTNDVMADQKWDNLKQVLVWHCCFDKNYKCSDFLWLVEINPIHRALRGTLLHKMGDYNMHGFMFSLDNLADMMVGW